MTIKNKIAAAAIGCLSLTGLVITTQPAQAATYTRICSSSGSIEDMSWYNNATELSVGSWLEPGDCDDTRYWYTDVTNVRVDVDETGSSSLGVDVDSYMIGHIDYGYGPCHDGETDSSNPPDDYANTGIRYKNFTNVSCVNG